MMRFGMPLLLFLWAVAPGCLWAAGPDPDIVFYDFMEADASGGKALKGGMYKDAEQGTRLKTLLKAAPIRSDGFYHMRFVADRESLSHARDYAELMLSNPAFADVGSRFKIEYVEGDADRMNCRNDVPESPRIIHCDMDYIFSLGEPAHMTAVFTSRGSGGAGGAVPIATLNYPLNTMLHEMLHGWGLNDEYTYSQSEADYYCSYPQILKGPNTASFPAREGYASDAEARSLHRNDISWLRYVRSDITWQADSGVLRLGTPATSSLTAPGLYPGSNCSLKMPSFRPYYSDTIMKSLSTNWIPPIHQKAVLAAIAKAAGW